MTPTERLAEALRESETVVIDLLKLCHEAAEHLLPGAHIDMVRATKIAFTAEKHIANARAALAAHEAQQQEPVAWIQRRMIDNFPAAGYETCEATDYGAIPVYTHPAAQQQEPGINDVEAAADALLQCKHEQPMHVEMFLAGMERAREIDAQICEAVGRGPTHSAEGYEFNCAAAIRAQGKK